MTRYTYSTCLSFGTDGEAGYCEMDVTVSFTVAWGSTETDAGYMADPYNYDPGSPDVVEDIKVESIDGKSARTGVKCADVDCPGSMRLVGPDEDGVTFWNRRPRETAHLSEIAALRGERDEWKGEWEAVCSERVKTADAVHDERQRGQAIIDERDKWIVELIRDKDELVKALTRAADDLRDIGNQSPRPTNSPDPEHENYLRRVLISLAQTGNTRARQALANQGAE